MGKLFGGELISAVDVATFSGLLYGGEEEVPSHLRVIRASEKINCPILLVFLAFLVVEATVT